MVDRWLIQIIGDQYPAIWTWSKINFVAFACHWLAMSHSAYNPIIYCCFNSKFRQVKAPDRRKIHFLTFSI